MTRTPSRSIVGVVPAAGHAVRLQPLEQSKEMLQVAGRPIIDHLVERMGEAGASEIRIVTRPDKGDVISYAESIGATLILGSPSTVNRSFAAGLAGLSPHDIALLGFPDSLWEPVDGYRRLVEQVEDGSEATLGLFDAPGVPGSDYLSFDESGHIAGFHIKPADPPSTWIWGCAAARVGALAGLDSYDWPSEHMDAVRRRGGLSTVALSDFYLDIGTPESLRDASSI